MSLDENNLTKNYPLRQRFLMIQNNVKLNFILFSLITKINNLYHFKSITIQRYVNTYK